MALAPKFAVYIPGLGRPDDAAVQALASAVGLSPVEARMVLASRLPKRVASTPDAQDAVDRVLSLKAAGFDAFAVSFEALHRSRPVRAKTARLSDDALEFDPGPRFTADAGVRLVVHGRILSGKSVKSTASTRTKYGTPVSVGANYEESGSSELFVHLYGASPAESVDLRPQAFNFRFLGADAGPTKVGALKAFFEKIRARWPALRFDDTLLRVPPAIDESSSIDSVDAGRLGKVQTETREGTNEGGVLKASYLLAVDALRPDFP